MTRRSKHDSKVDRVVEAFFAQTRFVAEPRDSKVSQTLQELARSNDNLIRVPIDQLPRDPVRKKNPGSSSGDEAFDVGLTASHVVETRAGKIRAEGNCLVCTCPECSAPMTVRAWLKLADCWRCMTSIALSEEQLAALELAEPPFIPTLEPALAADAPVAEHHPSPIYNPTPAMLPAATPNPDYQHRELERLTEGSVFARFVRRGFQLTPAWLASFLLHLVLILILALIVFGRNLEEIPTIYLSAALSSERDSGGQIRIEDALHQLQDDLPIASDLPENDREIRDVLERAEQSARELHVDPQPMAPRADLDVLRRNVTTAPDQLMSFVARDPRVRSEIVQREGGTLMTEAAVARGLRWLASVQNQDGSWSLADFERHDNPRNEGDTMGTALALLPFLGAGQTHEFGIYKANVASGLAWLLKNQTDDGDLRAGFRGNAGMYAHGQAAIVLCEALAMTGDEQFRQPAQMSIKFIEQGQHGQGGWRYQPGQVGDTSVLGWQVMALQSARSPIVGLEVDNATLSLADYFLDQVAVSRTRQSRSSRQTYPEGALYAYMPDRNATPAMTAEALLCRMYLGWKKDDPRLAAGVRWLIDEHPPRRSDMNVYYWYYGSQLLHNYGGQEWEDWNRSVKQLLLMTQDKRGRHPGSWDPDDFEWGDQGGRIYTTALSVCTLEVYYRHLPLFRKLDLDE